MKSFNHSKTRSTRRLSASAALFMAGALAGTLALGAGGLEAQQRSFTVGVSGGAIFPIGDLSDAYETGLDVGGLIEFASLGSLPLGFRAEGGYQTFSEGDLSTRFLSGRANAVIPFLTAPDARPYLIGGIGLYNGKTEFGPVSTSESELGANVGAGINWAIGGMDTFVELRLHNVFGEDDSVRFIPLTLGIRF